MGKWFERVLVAMALVVFAALAFYYPWIEWFHDLLCWMIS
jgi:hypothetical protein